MPIASPPLSWTGPYSKDQHLKFTAAFGPQEKGPWLKPWLNPWLLLSTVKCRPWLMMRGSSPFSSLPAVVPFPPHTLTAIAGYSCLVESPWCFSGLSTRLFSRPWPGLLFLLPVGGLRPRSGAGSALSCDCSLALLSTWDPSSAARLNPVSTAPSEPGALSQLS